MKYKGDKMKKQNRKTSNQNDGLFLYRDSKNRLVYAPLMSNIGYVISDNWMTEFHHYSYRTLVSVIAGMLVTMLTGYNLFYGIFAGLTVFIAWTSYYSVKLFKYLPPIKPFKRPKKDNLFVMLLKKYTKSYLLLFIVLGTVFIAFLSLYITLNQLDTTEFYTNIILITAMSIFVGIFLISLIIQQKYKTK
jgi:hypothetical protein